MESKSKSKFPGTSISYVRFRQKLPLKSYQILSELVVPVELYITTAKGRDDVEKVDTLRKSPFFFGNMGLGLTLPFRNKTSAIAVKNYPKEDITFLALSKFASFFNSLRIFCAALSA